MNKVDLIKDSVKGGVLAVCLYILWGAYKDQIDKTNKRVDILETRIIDCSQSYQNVMLNQIEKNNSFLDSIEQVMTSKRRY